MRKILTYAAMTAIICAGTEVMARTSNYSPTEIRDIMEKANSGDIKSLGIMGELCLEGQGVVQDSVMAERYLRESLKQGNPELFAEQLERAGKGDSFSSVLVSTCYLNGYSVEKDEEKAVPFLVKAAEADNVSAKRALGGMLAGGKKLKLDKQTVWNYIESAAKGGEPRAMYYLGEAYRKGDNVQRNYELSLAWYAQATARGMAGKFKHLITEEIYKTPYMKYMRGLKAYNAGKYDEAMKWFKEADDSDDAKIMTAVLYMTPGYSKHNDKKADGILDSLNKTREEISDYIEPRKGQKAQLLNLINERVGH